MTNPTAKIAAILASYTRDATVVIGSATTLAQLDIDVMDLPMIFLDIEDAFNVQIQYDEAVEDVASVEALVNAVTARLAAKASQPRIARVKSNWCSTRAAR